MGAGPAIEARLVVRKRRNASPTRYASSCTPIQADVEFAWGEEKYEAAP